MRWPHSLIARLARVGARAKSIRGASILGALGFDGKGVIGCPPLRRSERRAGKSRAWRLWLK